MTPKVTKNNIKKVLSESKKGKILTCTKSFSMEDVEEICAEYGFMVHWYNEFDVHIKKNHRKFRLC